MGNKNAMNWGWGWVYDDDEEKTTPTPKLIWGGPPTTKLTFATEDECRKIEVIIPKHLYQKKQDIWQELWERIKWEVKTEIEEWKAIGWRRTGWKSWGKVSEEIKRVGIFAILGGLAWYGGRYVVAMVREVCGWLWILFGLILLRLGLRSRSGMPVTPVRATADRDTDTEILHPQLEEETDSDMHSMQLTPVRVIVDRNTDTETLHPRLEEEMDSDKHSMQMTLTQVTADRDRDLDKARDWYRGVETESLYPRLDEETDLDMHSMQMTLAQGTADRDSGTDTETLHPRLEEETETDDLSSTGFETGSC
ncbi:hypothetical protein EAF00_012032 [Botryotinia globosa]|nr:hypothetical protein EAF00_012032 [Botryotinia globosa]